MSKCNTCKKKCQQPKGCKVQTCPDYEKKGIADK